MNRFQGIEPQDIAYFEGLLHGRALAGEKIPEDYGHDEMTEYGRFMPDMLLLAETEAEIQSVLKYCNHRRIAVTPRGSGTGLCGGCVPILGGVVLSTERMTRVLEVDRENMTATLEPGVLLMEFPKALEGTGLFYPPDPGEKSATLGGNVMTNAGGMRAVRYGVTRDYVLGMRVALAGGEVLELGGKTVKNASGYSLLDLMIGSEGTLGILTQLTVKLIPEPKENVSLLVPFDHLNRCIEAVPHILAGGKPTAVEFMEKEVITAAEEYLGKQFPNKNADAFLLIRLDDPAPGVLEEMAVLLEKCGAQDVLLADTDERKESIWDARGAFLEAINSSTPSMDECDVVVPPRQIASFVKKATEIGKTLRLRIRSFGHAGDGNLHIYICKDQLTDKLWEEKRKASMSMLYEAALALGGQVSGEHGIGHAKVPFLRERVGETQWRLLLGIKSLFDPEGILNPGKVVGYAPHGHEIQGFEGLCPHPQIPAG